MDKATPDSVMALVRQYGAANWLNHDTEALLNAVTAEVERLAAQSAPTKPKHPLLTITAKQLRAALDFLNPDADDTDQLETELCIQWGEARDDGDGGTEPAGLRAWFAECPNEGSISLDSWGAEEPPAAQSAPRFEETSCSQCGTSLGPGDSGVSSCCDHGACQVMARGDKCECDRSASRLQKLQDHLDMARAGRLSTPIDEDAIEAEIQGLRVAQSAPLDLEYFEVLATDIEAIGAMYRGDPRYEHDAYWMREQAAKTVRDFAARIAADPAVAQSAPLQQAAREYPPLPEGKAAIRCVADTDEGGWVVDFDCEGPLSHEPEEGDVLFTADQMHAYLDADRAAAQVEPSKVDAYERTTQPSLTTGYEAHQKNGLAWAVNCWVQEVKYRPLINVHRRTLDDTWRQVIRYFGGDPDKLIGPSHDALMDAEPKRNGRPISWGEESPTAQVEPVRMLPACEQQYILSNPSAIMELMTYRYLQQDQADSMEAGTHGDHTRYVELARLGQSIIDQDPECFSEELRDEYARALRYIELQDAAGKRIPADGEVRNV